MIVFPLYMYVYCIYFNRWPPSPSKAYQPPRPSSPPNPHTLDHLVLIQLSAFSSNRNFIVLYFSLLCDQLFFSPSLITDLQKLNNTFIIIDYSYFSSMNAILINTSGLIVILYHSIQFIY